MSLYTDFQHKIFFLLKKSFSLLPTMYILVHFKLSFKNTLTSITRVKIPNFATAAPLKSVDLLPDLLSRSTLENSPTIPTFEPHNPYFHSTF